MPTLGEILDNKKGEAYVSVFLSQKDKEEVDDKPDKAPTDHTGVNITRSARPDWENIFAALTELKGKPCVLACGPEPLVDDLQNVISVLLPNSDILQVCRRISSCGHEISFHKESFMM